MDSQEKILYHQIHPMKLFTDWSTGLVSVYLLWKRQLREAIILGFVPPILVSLALIRFANLEKYKESGFGRYVRRYMTRPFEMLRFLGYGVMAIGGWFHKAWLIPLGLMVIVFAWLRGVILP